MPSISIDKVQRQRQLLIQDQIQKSQNSIKKLEYNQKILLSKIPQSILDQKIEDLLRQTQGDLNKAIYEQLSKAFKYYNTQNEKLEIQGQKKQPQKEQQPRLWDKRLQNSPPKNQPKKRIIKNPKKNNPKKQEGQQKQSKLPWKK